ncbi:MAG: ribosomal protein S18-alanine N-acetyltransferase [Syntrophomonadaceae bacterium]|jgi:ribosomal-protein-alanine N-acetyltransferase|nr:ribosomal protein S18-alanine N-acetyltransferase [Syntrophomonadaceae bacterium]
MTAQDLDGVMQVELESFPLPWSRASYLGELKNTFANYLVCDVGGQIVGFGGIWVVFEEAHITNVAIASEHRQRGLGKLLMDRLEAIAREKRAQRILLEVRTSNYPAQSMYNSLGFIPTGLRKEYYTDNKEDAIIMTKFLI